MNIKQKRILRKLVVRNGQKYSDLYKGFEYEDKFPYHLKHLVEKNLVNKREGRYFLTKSGMKATAFFDSRTLDDFELKIPRLVFICNKNEKYLLVPLFDSDEKRESYYTLPSGNAVVGDTLDDACNRMLQEKYGIDGTYRYRSTHHHTWYTTDGDILFDDICLIFDVAVYKVKGKTDKWFSLGEIKRIKNKLPLIDKYIIQVCRGAFYESESVGNFGFEEKDLL